MKSRTIPWAVFFMILVITGTTLADSMEELVGEYKKKYESLTPPANSSVNTDYKQEQTALGILYFLNALNLFHQQNQKAIEKETKSLNKLDKIISQNQKIIELLSILAEKEEKNPTLPIISEEDR